MHLLRKPESGDTSHTLTVALRKATEVDFAPELQAFQAQRAADLDFTVGAIDRSPVFITEMPQNAT